MQVGQIASIECRQKLFFRRCAECKDINPGCAWSKGIYPGVLLLYMQELAVNRVLTKPTPINSEIDAKIVRRITQAQNRQLTAAGT